MTDPFDLDAALAKHIKKPSEVSLPELILLYSPPGSGKSWLAASISEVEGVGRTLILDTEGSTVGAIADFDDDKIDIVNCQRDNDIESFKFLNTILERLADSTTKHSWGAVVIDTFDVAQEWAHAYFEENAPIGRNGEKDGFAVWREVKAWSIDTARMLRRIEAYGVLVVHDREEKDKDGAVVTKLNLLGSAKDVLPGIPGVVGYLRRVLEDGEEVTYAEFASQDNKVTKNRFKFPPVVKNPSFKALYEYIEKNKNVAKEAVTDGS